MNETDMQLFSSLIKGTDQIDTACYSSDGTLLSTTDSAASVMLDAFSLLGCKETMLAYSRNHRMPITLGSAIGLEWIAAFQYEDNKLVNCWVIGPAFYQDISTQAIDAYLSSSEKITVAFANRFREALKHISVIPNMINMRYVVMLHYCINHEWIRNADINSETIVSETLQNTGSFLHHEHVWDTEQALLSMVREGNLNYRQALTASRSISNGVPVKGKDPLRQAKTSIIVFISLVTRAAIDGGLSPDEAYSLGDSYINTVESSQNKAELDQLTLAIYDDFIHRVHDHKKRPGISPKIQECCDYIELHSEEKITMDTLSKRTGYTKYYLSKRFKAETGMLINDYIRNAKLSQAKLLLLHSPMSLQEISDHLSFSSRNYFANIFHEAVGMTPTEYRNSSKKAD
ncbi:MAG: AraC family transcriptional regulator [Solobacterium sp.]|jgi:AraC-like DNA-binding protein|nr:AraC family transcriptional regulator [Solobacterium sp.]